MVVVALAAAITFNRWRGRGLEFGPVYFERSADDLGPTPRFGIGKGSICAMKACPYSTALLDQPGMTGAVQ